MSTARDIISRLELLILKIRVHKRLKLAIKALPENVISQLSNQSVSLNISQLIFDDLELGSECTEISSIDRRSPGGESQ